MSNAKGGQILISEPTAEKLGKSFDLERLPELKVKGRSEAVPVFSVNWIDKAAAATVAMPKKRRLARGAPQSRKIST
jgi:class 3 adenylate cyclase